MQTVELISCFLLNPAKFETIGEQSVQFCCSRVQIVLDAIACGITDGSVFLSHQSESTQPASSLH